MTAIDILGVDAVKVAHAGGEIAFHRFDYEVVVVAHLAPGVNPPVVAFAGFGKNGEPPKAVGIIAVDVLTPVAARGNVIQATSQFES